MVDVIITHDSQRFPAGKERDRKKFSDSWVRMWLKDRNATWMVTNSKRGVEKHTSICSIRRPFKDIGDLVTRKMKKEMGQKWERRGFGKRISLQNQSVCKCMWKAGNEP